MTIQHNESDYRIGPHGQWQVQTPAGWQPVNGLVPRPVLDVAFRRLVQCPWGSIYGR